MKSSVNLSDLVEKCFSNNLLTKGTSNKKIEVVYSCEGDTIITKKKLDTGYDEIMIVSDYCAVTIKKVNSYTYTIIRETWDIYSRIQIGKVIVVSKNHVKFFLDDNTILKVQTFNKFLSALKKLKGYRIEVTHTIDAYQPVTTKKQSTLLVVYGYLN